MALGIWALILLFTAASGALASSELPIARRDYESSQGLPRSFNTSESAFHRFEKRDSFGLGTIQTLALGSPDLTTMLQTTGLAPGGSPSPHIVARHLDILQSMHNKVHKAESNLRGEVTHVYQDVTQKLDQHFQHSGDGNWVVNRTNGQLFWEFIPTFTEAGMHLIFNTTHFGPHILKPVFRWFTNYMGKQYDQTDASYVINHINAFVQEYDIDTTELLQPNLSLYPTFNSFFARKLRPGARPIDSPNDERVITSPADCRAVVFQSVDLAKQFWIKGQGFSIAKLLNTDDASVSAMFGDQPDIAVFRLAPQDYHRFHAPVSGTLLGRTAVEGTYYTVNPQAVKENLDVFGENNRVVQYISMDTVPGLSRRGISSGPEQNVVAVVAIGALLVGSVRFTVDPGQHINKGDDFGYFQYGGSTVALIAKQNTVIWDEDLDKNSLNSTEMLIRVGNHVGTF